MWLSSCTRQPASRSPRLLLCLAACLALCAMECAAAAKPTQQQQQQQEYSCDALDKVPQHMRCSFVREHCPAESIVPYVQWYFCHVAPHNVLLRSLYLAAVCCLLPLAFCLLGDTAEFYIAPIMAHVSQAIPKMRPRFAGVTFVALGNGAPDLSANIAAISSGEVVLSAGAVTGAAMFVQCVVAAELISLAGDAGIKCGGAMLRDVGVYGVAITSVLLAFALGQVTRAFVGWSIALYIVYMIWVFAGDEWHQRGRPKPEFDPQAFMAMINRIALRNRTGMAAGGGLAAGPRGRSTSSGGGSRGPQGTAAAAAGPGGGYSSRDDLEESLLPWVDAEVEEAYDSYYDSYDDHAGGGVGGLGFGGAAGVGMAAANPPAFETSVVASPSFGGVAVGTPVDGGDGVCGFGSRPSSFTGPSQQQRSTEMSSVPGARQPGSAAATAPPAVRGAGAAGWHRDGRRASEPSYSSNLVSSPAAAAAAVAAAVAGGGGEWAAAPDGALRQSSATLPTPAALNGGGWVLSPRQQQLRHHSAVSGMQRHGSSLGPHLVSLGRQSFIDPKTYKQLVWADLADDDEEEARLEREIARQLIAGAGRSRAAAPSAAGSYFPPAVPAGAAVDVGSPSLAREQQPLLSPAAQGDMEQQQQWAAAPRQLPQPQPAVSPGADSGGFMSPFGSAGVRSGPTTPSQHAGADEAAAGMASDGLSKPQGWHDGAGQLTQQVASPASGRALAHHHQQQQQWQMHLAEQQQQPGAGGMPLAQVDGAGAGDSWQQLQWQVTLGNSEEWLEAGPVIKLFRKVTFPLLLPAYLGQRLTIPFASSAGYSREWLIVALLCCPLALIAYLGLLSLPAVLAACGAGIAASLLGAVLTAWDQPGQMAVQGLGGRAAAVVPGVLAVLAFVMGVVWIDTVATEVVGIITFLAGLARLPDGVMGLTLLAWGNSLGDYFGNRAMAKAGHTSTAITACFAAPLFNMLISLACGFSSYLHKLGTTAVKVTLTPEVALGCIFLIGYNAAIICVGHMCGQRLPPWFRHFARAWYALYFTLAVASGFYLQQSS